jgi:hypothetical protein
VSAHRRPSLRAEAAAALRATGLRGKRRASSRRPIRLLPVALGIGVLGVAAITGPAVIGSGWTPGGSDSGHEQISFAALPKDAPGQGLVYDGLQPAGPGTLCAGSFQLDDTTCTHGPDLAPAGLTVSRDVAAVTGKVAEPVVPVRESATVPTDGEIVRDEGGSALTPDAPAFIPDAAPGDADFIMGSHGVACEGDGRTGNRVQVMYLHEFGTPSRYSEFLGSMRTWAAGVDQIFDASAGETGGSRHVRFVTTTGCRVDVAEVQVPQGSLASFGRSIQALQTLGYNRSDRKYLIFADANVYCGIGTYLADQRPGLSNRNNGGPSYGRIDAGCWGAQTAAHELTQTLGAVLQGSPNASGGGSCTDDYDLLCGPDRSKAKVRDVCPRTHEVRLDCGHDDYFSTNPRPGSWLATHWNVGNSDFLLRSDGGDDIPDVPGAVVPTTAPASPSATPAAKAADKAPAAPATSAPATPSATPTPAPSDSPAPASPGDDGLAGVAVDRAAAVSGPPVQAVLEVRDPTSTAVHLTWTAAAPSATYKVSVNGEPVATTVATRGQLIGLRPDTTYTVTIADARDKYLAKSSAQTAPAARPAQNSWFVLTNMLTGGAADLYAARTANGTPLTLGESDSDAQEQWRLVPAGKNTFVLQSKATLRCVVPTGGNPVTGTPLVEGDCGPDAQHWQLQLSTQGQGFVLRIAGGDLVAGVGEQRFGAHRVLTLQTDTQDRHQSWTAVPG